MPQQQRLLRRFSIRWRARRRGLRARGFDRLLRDRASFIRRVSTKTWILPPQASPTSQACSLVTPKSSSRGLPSLIVCSALARSPRLRRSRPRPSPGKRRPRSPPAWRRPAGARSPRSSPPWPRPRPCRRCASRAAFSRISVVVVHALYSVSSRSGRQPPRPAGAGPAGSSAATSCPRLSRLCTGRNSSTCGSIARMPSDFGSNPS